MIPQTAIVQIAKKIGRELNSGAEPSEEALAAGPILAEAGATPGEEAADVIVMTSRRISAPCGQLLIGPDQLSVFASLCRNSQPSALP